MSFSDKFLCFIFLLLGLTLGLTISKTYENLPYFKWDNEVDVLSLFSLITTVIIAFAIPFVVKKLIEDNRQIKSLLIEELKLLIAALTEVKSIINECHSRGDIKDDDKDRINYAFHEADLQLVSLREQLLIAFPAKAKTLTDNLTDSYFEYNGDLTGGVLMTSKFKVVDDQFRRNHDTSFSNLVTKIKKATHSVHKF